MNALTMNGQPLHKIEPASKDFGRIRQQRKTLLQIGHFLRSPFAGPSEAVRIHRACGHGPELDEILRREIDLVALAQQSGESLSSDGMLFGSRVGQAQQQIGVGRDTGPSIVDGVASDSGIRQTRPAFVAGCPTL